MVGWEPCAAALASGLQLREICEAGKLADYTENREADRVA